MTKKILTIAAILLLAAGTNAFGYRHHNTRDNSRYRNRKSHTRTWNRNSRYYRAPVRNRRAVRRIIRKRIIRRRIIANRYNYKNRNHYRYNR